MNILKKAGKILLYILAGLLVLLFIAGLFLDPIAKDLLEKQVSKAAKGQYTLALNDLDVSILQGDVQLTGVRLDTDSTSSAAPPIVFLRADEITIDGVAWLTYLLDEKLLVDRVFLDNLNVRLFAKTVQQNKQDTSSKSGPFKLDQLDIYPVIKQNIDRLHLKDLGLTEISFTLVNTSSQDTLRFNASELNFQSDNILVDADKLITDSRALYSTAINLKTKDVEVVRSGNKKMTAEADLIQFVTEEDIMSFQTKKLAFLRSSLNSKDTLLFAGFNNFEVRKLDLNKIQEENTAELEEISLHQLNLVNHMPPAPGAAQQQQQDTVQASGQKTSLAELSLGEFLPEFIERVKLHKFAITNAFVKQGDSIKVENANFEAGNILINEQSAFAGNRVLHAQGIESYIDLVAASVGNPTLNLTLSDFRINIEDGVGQLGFEELQAVPKDKPAGKKWFKAAVGPFAVVDINMKNLLKRELSIDSIGIQSPVFLVNIPATKSDSQQKTSRNERQSAAFTPPNLYPLIAPFLDRLHLRKLAVIKAEIKLEEEQEGKFIAQIPAAYLQLRDVLIAEGTAYENGRVLHTEDIALRVEDILYPMPDSIYTAKLGLFRLSTFEKFMEAKDFRISHRGNGAKVSDSLKTRMVFELQHDMLRMDGIRFSRMIREEGVFIETIKSRGLEAHFFQNSNYPIKGKTILEMIPAMPQQLLEELKMPLYVGSFDLGSGKIIYEQLPSGADTAGVLEVTDFFVNAKNVTNLQYRLRRNPEVLLGLGGKLMGSGPFQTELVIHMLSDSSLVQITGDVDTLDMTTLNRYTNYTTPLAFSSGKLYQMKWDIAADAEIAKGSLLMSYEDLTIKLSEAKSSDTTGIFKDIGSFLINNLALETDVPAENPKEPEKAEISNENEKKNFVNYYVTSLVDGLKDIVVTIF